MIGDAFIRHPTPRVLSFTGSTEVGVTSWKLSHKGRYNGQWSIEEFTTVHWILVQHEPGSVSILARGIPTDGYDSNNHARCGDR